MRSVCEPSPALCSTANAMPSGARSVLATDGSELAAAAAATAEDDASAASPDIAMRDVLFVQEESRKGRVPLLAQAALEVSHH